VEGLLDKATEELQEYQAMTKHAVQYIRDHLQESLSVSAMASAVHASTRTLQRALKETLNCSPTEILLAVKMHEAKRLLGKGSMNVSETAYRLGFENADHFSRRFKSYYGVPPSAFVRAAREQT
jgi:AraC-like DNA-binding protein